MEARRTSWRIAFAMAVAGISMAIAAAPAWAQPLTKAQQKCVNGLNKDFSKIDAAVAKQISACIKNNAKGKDLNKNDPGIDTLEECVLDDPNGKIQKAKDKAVQNFQKFCTGLDKDGVATLPSWAATDATTVSMAGMMKTIDLAGEIFGSPLDSGVLVTEAAEKDASKCQQAVWKAVTKCEATKVKEFLGCKKLAFKAGSVASGAELEAACLMQNADPQTGQPDDKDKIAKACVGSDGGIGKALAKKCAGADLDALFPGCAGEDHAACLDREVECQVCLALDAADALARDCDLFDDGEANATCGDVGPTPSPVPTATPTPAPTPTPVPTPTPTPTAPPPGCTTATVRTVVTFSSNEATGVVATVGYGSGVSIPGTGNQPQVAQRVTKLNPATGIFSVGDSDSQPPFQLNVGLVVIPGPIPQGDFAEIEFDCESGTPTLGDFTCSSSVSDLLGLPIDSNCSMTLQLD